MSDFLNVLEFRSIKKSDGIPVLYKCINLWQIKVSKLIKNLPGRRSYYTKGECKMNKKRLTVLICALATATFTTTPVLAANTTDKPYGYTSITASNYHETSHYEKTNESKVYVKPSKSPSGKTNVRTYCKQGGITKNKTVADTVTLSNNKAYGITNNVYEHGDKTSEQWVMMWLNVKATSGSGKVSGVWSPDWSGTTSVTIV